MAPPYCKFADHTSNVQLERPTNLGDDGSNKQKESIGLLLLSWQGMWFNRPKEHSKQHHVSSIRHIHRSLDRTILMHPLIMSLVTGPIWLHKSDIPICNS